MKTWWGNEAKRAERFRLRTWRKKWSQLFRRNTSSKIKSNPSYKHFWLLWTIKMPRQGRNWKYLWPKITPKPQTIRLRPFRKRSSLYFGELWVWEKIFIIIYGILAFSDYHDSNTSAKIVLLESLLLCQNEKA